MLYRKFRRCRHDVSILGFGCMRLPPEAGQPAGGKIDVPPLDAIGTGVTPLSRQKLPPHAPKE